MKPRSCGSRWHGVALLLVAIVGGCARPALQQAEPVRPVKTLVVAPGEGLQERIFPGVVEAVQRVDLAFQVSGLLVNLPVKEGQKVAAGQTIAELRPDEFKARLKALRGQLDRARATLAALRAGERPEERLRREAAVRQAAARMENARVEAARAERLIQRNAISRADYDLANTTYRVAVEEHQAAVQLAEKGVIGREEEIVAAEGEVRSLEGRVVEANIQLQDATLRAPYEGVIAQRFVEQGQNVQAKAPIVRLQDAQEIEVVVDVPEAIMAGEIRQADIAEILATLSGAPDRQFPLTIREIAQVADPTTRTFRVRAAAKAMDDVRSLPGMTASVVVKYRRAKVLGAEIMVPVTAVTQRSSSGDAAAPVVWIIDRDGTVDARPVKLGRVQGGNVEITQGLQAGDRIAVAGVNQLHAGMKVRDLGDELGGGGR